MANYIFVKKEFRPDLVGKQIKFKAGDLGNHPDMIVTCTEMVTIPPKPPNKEPLFEYHFEAFGT